MSFTSKKWVGKEKIVVAIDCGTTQSGVAYSYLFPGGNQTVQRVVHWPGQEAQKGEAKIPTLVWYDKSKKPRAFGAEALSTRIKNQAEDEEWELAEHFKLHLHPSTMRAEQEIIVQPLPRGVALDQIYADFFGYLYKHTRTFFQNREVNGQEIWERLETSIEIVIAHPNGWGAHEQAFLRKVAVLGGLVPGSTAQERVHVVSEGEASVHYVMLHGDIERRLEVGVDFVVCDAGGSTVDTTLYTVAQTSPVLELKEKKASACVQAGAIFVNQTAIEYFDTLFQSAGFDKEDLAAYTQEAVDSFESEGKRAFEGPDQDDVSIKVGGHRFTDKSINVRRGILSIESSQVEKFFSPWTEQIIRSVEDQMKGHNAQYILLVGGFGDSPYLRKKFQQHRPFRHAEITQTNDLTAKAVAEGAAIWHIQHSVTARATRYAYGMEIRRQYNSYDARHSGRPITQHPEGDFIAGGWSEIVPKGQVIQNDEDRRSLYYRSYNNPNPNLSVFTIDLYARTIETDEAPYYLLTPNGTLAEGFSLACTIEADISNMRGGLKQLNGPKGKYWALDFEVGILFGTTELAAVVIWKDSWGVEHRGPATVIPKRLT